MHAYRRYTYTRYLSDCFAPYVRAFYRLIMGVYLTGMYFTAVHFMGVYLTGVYLTGMHLTSVYLSGVHLVTGVSHRYILYSRTPRGASLTGVHLTGVHQWAQLLGRSSSPWAGPGRLFSSGLRPISPCGLRLSQI